MSAGSPGSAGTILDSYTAGQVSASQSTAGGLVGVGYNVDSCYSTASVDGVWGVGGLVGDNGQSVSRSYSSGPVAAEQSGGGLVGTNGGSISISYSTSPVTGTGEETYGIGGLVGYNSGPVSECFSSGPVSGSGPFGGFGGLVGINDGGSITNCYWDTGTSGQTSSAGGTGLTTDDAMVSASYVGFGFHPQYGDPHWYQWEGATRPFLFSEWRTAIANAHQLQLMAVEAGIQCDFTLVRDIEMSELARASGMWKPAIGFQPTYPFGDPVPFLLDGGGHTISGLVVHGGHSGQAGLFYHAYNATISNLGLVGVSVTGTDFVGAFLGINDFGAIINCYATGSVAGQSHVGGLVGAGGNLTNCYSACAVTGDQYAGGLVGLNYGGVTSSYSAGPVTGSSGIGGLVGYNYGTVTNSFWDTVTTGQAHSSGSADSFGLTTAQMMQLATFTGAAWDIDAAGSSGKIWRIYNDQDVSASCAVSSNRCRPPPPMKRGPTPASLTAAATAWPFHPRATTRARSSGQARTAAPPRGPSPPGSYAITPGAWSNQQGYDITAISGALTINSAPGVGRVPDGITGAPLQICKNFTQLDLTWGASCGAAATNFAVYEGTIGSWTSHTPLLCSTSNATSATVTASSGDRYYLVVPLSTTQEGSYGTTSAGAEIPQSMSPCKASQDLSGCL